MPTEAAAAVQEFPPDRPMLNLGDSFPNLEDLRREFDILYFLDLCSGIEACILYDEIYVNPRTNGGGAEPLLQPLYREGVLVPFALTAENPMRALHSIFSRQRAAEISQRLRQRGGWLDTQDMDLAIIVSTAASGLASELALEEDFRLTLLPAHRPAPIYSSLPSVNAEQRSISKLVVDLAQTSDALKHVLTGMRRHWASSSAVDSLPLPPLGFEAVAGADTFDELGEIVLDLRKRYAPLRKRLREIRELYASSDTPFSVRVLEVNRIKRDIKRLFKHARLKDVPNLLEIAGDVEKLGEAIPSILEGNYAGVFKLAEPLVKAADALAWRFRMRPLRRTTDRYLNASASQIAEATRKLFKHDLCSGDEQRIRAYDKACAKYFPPLRVAEAAREPPHRSSPKGRQRGDPTPHP